MPRRYRRAQLALGTVELNQDGRLPFAPAEALLQSLRPGTQNRRYDRDWRMGQFQQQDGWVFGRIGFQRPGSQTELWSDDLKDFRPSTLTEGYTSPFAIDLDTLRLAFQLRAGLIKPTTFTSNFRALLEKASGFLWNVRPLIEDISFDEWRKDVDRIIEVRVRIERPNPNYHGRRHVRALIEGSGAKIVNMIFRSDPNDEEGLKVDAGALAEALDHAEEYGKFEAKGETVVDEVVEVSRWREDVEGSPKLEQAQADPDTGEVLPEELRRVLEDELPP